MGSFLTVYFFDRGENMLAAERQSKIIEMTERKGSVQVEELASELKVSAMTVSYTHLDVYKRQSQTSRFLQENRW